MFNSQLIHVIRQIKGKKRSIIKLIQNPFSYTKTRKDSELIKDVLNLLKW